MPNRAPKHVIRKLRELRRHASLQNAKFGFNTDKVDVLSVPYRGEHTVDDFVKEVTKAHRNTWILPLVDELIAWAEGSE